jgi:uncharacterized protein with NAD-binding domain and iron-sulfur cluster
MKKATTFKNKNGKMAAESLLIFFKYYNSFLNKF